MKREIHALDVIACKAVVEKHIRGAVLFSKRIAEIRTPGVLRIAVGHAWHAGLQDGSECLPGPYRLGVVGPYHSRRLLLDERAQVFQPSCHRAVSGSRPRVVPGRPDRGLRRCLGESVGRVGIFEPPLQEAFDADHLQRCGDIRAAHQLDGAEAGTDGRQAFEQTTEESRHSLARRKATGHLQLRTDLDRAVVALRGRDVPELGGRRRLDNDLDIPDFGPASRRVGAARGGQRRFDRASRDPAAWRRRPTRRCWHRHRHRAGPNQLRHAVLKRLHRGYEVWAAQNRRWKSFEGRSCVRRGWCEPIAAGQRGLRRQSVACAGGSNGRLLSSASLTDHRFDAAADVALRRLLISAELLEFWRAFHIGPHASVGAHEGFLR